MIPAALSSMLEQGVVDFLRMSFWSSTQGMEDLIERFIKTEGAVFKGPYVSVKLPFRSGSNEEIFPKVPLGYPQHLHQERAWARLNAEPPKSTLVATGTGSGKTESFLLPILDYCRRHAGTPGVKAILIYPMNALATDQARRIAELCDRTPALKGVKAGLYIGESREQRNVTHGKMGKDHIITDRARMKREPPDILLTNYKMLDYLLVRRKDQQMWQPNSTTPLRFLVVDELHNFDGAQGTDLACLVRRLKARLGAKRGSLCCVGTSATLGGNDAEGALRSYAQEIFGEPFDEGCVISETRQTPDELFGSRLIARFALPDDPDVLDPSKYERPEDYVIAQQRVWCEEPIAAPPGSDAWKVALGEQLLEHAVLRNLVQLLRDQPVLLSDLVASFARSSAGFRKKPDAAKWAVVSVLSLVSEARTWLPEREEARKQREERNDERRTRPLLEVRLQLWQRELRRMVADLGASKDDPPSLRFSDDLTDEQRARHLPLVHCRDCGAMGWATYVARDRSDLYGAPLNRFYRAFFSDDPQVRFLWPAAAAKGERGFERLRLDRVTLTRTRDDASETAVDFAQSDNVRIEQSRPKLQRDCPFCNARQSLTLVGFRASMLTSVFIGQLFSSRFNDDKKLLAFSDSVQDAAYRAGFFGARTWGFNLRVALQKVAEKAEGKTLAELPALFARTWRKSAAQPGTPASSLAVDDVAYVALFLAPNMEWLHEYEAMQKDGILAASSPLLAMVDRRVAFEIANEYGMQARIGRSLPRTGCSTLAIDSTRLDAATDALLPRLQNEVGGLRALDRVTLRRFLLGALQHLREVGGIDHDELPRRFVESEDEYAFKLANHLPSFGPKSRYPALLTTNPRSTRFDVITSSPWYERWTTRMFGGVATLVAEARDVWSVVLPALVSHGILKETLAAHGTVWGLSPAALRVTSRCVRLRCKLCKHWFIAAESEAPDLIDALCLNAPCAGAYEAEPETINYFGRLIVSGEVARVFPEEHTGLLQRPEREHIENEFKAKPENRKPWYPNLLSCTPTLEMGIDIGDLSSAILCSVPPGQANYLQRIGRAGRRDGNSLVLTIAQGRPHDLYFYAKPTEMLAGAVQPPGVFLNASAVLERQLAAFSLDQWNQTPGDPHFAPTLGMLFRTYPSQSDEHFPNNWLAFTRREEKRLLADFVALFNHDGEPAVLTDATVEHLRKYLMGDEGKEGSLGWKVRAALDGEKQSLGSLWKKADRLKKLVKELKEAVARDQDHDDVIAEHEREQAGHERLARDIEDTLTLEFFTNEGLLPNYAFPEAAVRLRSVIWRKREKTAEGGSAFETKTFGYTRPPVAALSELAPLSEFYAGGRRVTIDQVDVEAAEVEEWRFCDRCTHCASCKSDETPTDCPICHSPGWGEESQRRPVLKMHQVFARTSDRDSRIRDDVEEREPRFFNRHMLPMREGEERDGAWKLGAKDVPFAFEYLRRITFRELNFGEPNDDTTQFSIAGNRGARQGFVICRHCGKVQDRRRQQQRSLPAAQAGKHALWCGVRQREAKASDFETAVYLYREFTSEAVRLLLPLPDIGSDRRLHSFVAAFQLGLKARFGGRVDHLQTLVYSEPEAGGVLRRQYLVIYDAVPGGTGYLKHLVQEPKAGEPHPLLELLALARDRIRTCECYGEPGRDGCYRCLFAYRNSRDMSDTSAREALLILSEILDQAHTLTRAESLSDVSVEGLLESVLERRFLEALQRLGGATSPVSVTKAVVRNKAGYQVTAGDKVWLVEPQVPLGPADGFFIPLEIDFVFRAAVGNAEPIAVFTDGFEFHKDRVGKDMLQRMALRRAGYDVWCFTWQDVDAAFDKSVPLPKMQVHEDGARLKDWFKKLDLGAFTGLIDAQPLQLFHKLLAGEAVPWEAIGCATLIAQLKPSPELAAFRAEVAELVPAPLQPLLACNDQLLLTRRRGEHHGTLSLVATGKREAVGKTPQLDGFAAAVWLDDDPAHHDSPAYREAWRAYLLAFTFLRRLPNVVFLTHVRAAADLYAKLAHTLASTNDAWAQLDVIAGFVPLTEKLAAADVPLAKAGVDLPDAHGLSSGVEGELVWEKEHVAVLRTNADAAKIAAEWKTFTLDECLADLGPLVAALRGTSQGAKA